MRRDGRIPDEEIVREYGQEAIVEITGKRGTLLAVDTRGFHKGKALESGDRLLFQVEYTNSLFGAPYNRMDIDGTWSERALAQIRATRRSFSASSGPHRFDAAARGSLTSLVALAAGALAARKGKSLTK